MENEPKYRILIVDDDEQVNRLLRSIFSSAGFEVMSGTDGVEGLDLATKHVPDVIITGIIMPRMSGFDMIRSLKNNVSTARIPMIVFSHLGRQEDKEEAEKLGVKAFLVRGLVSPVQIIEKVRMLFPHGDMFYLEFDPQAADAKRLREVFNLPPYFECPDGGRMKLRLEGSDDTKDPVEFKATFTCERNSI